MRTPAEVSYEIICKREGIKRLPDFSKVELTKNEVFLQGWINALEWCLEYTKTETEKKIK